VHYSTGLENSHTQPLPDSEIFATEISEFSARHPTITGLTEILQRSSHHYFECT